MSPQKDFEEFFAALNAEKVRYLVVGAYCLAFHGIPRFTKDLDIWVDPKYENAEAVLRSLESFGLSSMKIAARDLTEQEQVIQIGYPPNRIDLFTSIDAIKFETAWKQRVSGVFGKQKTHYLSLKHLMKNKLATNRDQDRVDVKLIQKILRSK